MVVACTQSHEQPRLPPRQTPIPEELRPRQITELIVEPAPAEPNRTAPEIKGSIPRRFGSPGAVRWSLDLGQPIRSMRWTPLAGLVVSTDKDVHNVTSQGIHRFRSVAGTEHSVFALGEAEVIWSPAFSRIQQLRRWGRHGWQREWHGEVTADELGNIFLLDASTVSLLAEDGSDRWRASPAGLRSLKGPFLCSDDMLFHGIRGLGGVAVRVSKRGFVMRETTLERGAALVGAGPDCEPLVWKRGKTALLDTTGKIIWQLSSFELPFVTRGRLGFAFVHFMADQPVRIEGRSDSGRSLYGSSLPVSGRVTAARLSLGDNIRPLALGLCIGVSSPCSRSGDNRGPFNTLLMGDTQGRLRIHIRHLQGHVSFVPYPDGGMVVASSAGEKQTDLTLRDERHGIVWQLQLPGRLSAGPYVGPSGEVYVGTCRNWECTKPHLLTAITGRVPPESDE